MNVPILLLIIIAAFVLVQKNALSEEDTVHFKAKFKNFYSHHHKYKWTYLGDKGDEHIICKVDVVESNDGSQVKFRRQYNESGAMKTEELTGKFSETAPAYMYVYKNGRHENTEQLVVLDRYRVCGIVYTIAIRNISPGGSSLLSCEVRIRTDRNGPRNPGLYYQCESLFTQYCRPRYYVYYSNCTVSPFLHIRE